MTNKLSGIPKEALARAKTYLNRAPKTSAIGGAALSTVVDGAPTATCAFIGDVRLFDASDAPLLDPAVQRFLDGHDIRCCNFEGAAWHENAVTNKKAGPALLQGKRSAARVLSAGFTMASLANNHMMDYGERGLAATINALSGITTLGAGETPPLAGRPYITTVNGVKLGFLALSEKQYGVLGGGNAAGVAWINDPAVFYNIRCLRSETHHVILLCHAGLENVPLPLPEWRALYRRMIDAGASAVIACHPHVPQGSERYKNGVIAYSLGNAAWEPCSMFPETRSLLASVSFPVHGAPELTLHPVVWENGQVRFDVRRETADMLAELNRVLRDEKVYEAEVRRICLDFYETHVVSDAYAVTGALPGGKWQWFKNAAKLILRKRGLNEPLLLSMLENESYRWAAEAALRARRPEGT